MTIDPDQTVYKVVATKTVTATFEVYADDEEDARFSIENAVGTDFEVDCEDAMQFQQDDWDVSTIEPK